jgi:hypothetical protein
VSVRVTITLLGSEILFYILTEIYRPINNFQNKCLENLKEFQEI